MRKRNLIIIISLMILLVGCSSWQNNMVKGYEAAGVMGKTYYSIARTNCDNGSIPPPTCDQLKKTNNDAQKVYFTAGSTLTAAINIEDAIRREEFLIKYNQLMAETNKVTLQILRILRDLKLL